MKTTLAEEFLVTKAREAKGAIFMAFDWDKAAKVIKEKFETNKDLVAEAGLEGDWKYTG